MTKEQWKKDFDIFMANVGEDPKNTGLQLCRVGQDGRVTRGERIGANLDAPLGTPRRRKNMSIRQRLEELNIGEGEISKMTQTLEWGWFQKIFVNSLRAQRDRARYQANRLRPRFDTDEKLIDKDWTAAKRLGMSLSEFSAKLERMGRGEALKTWKAKRMKIKERVRHEWMSERYENIVGALGKGPHAPEYYIDIVAGFLCRRFKELTGGPQHGLVGAMLRAAGLERGEYEKLRRRVAERVRRSKVSAG